MAVANATTIGAASVSRVMMIMVMKNRAAGVGVGLCLK